VHERPQPKERTLERQMHRLLLVVAICAACDARIINNQPMSFVLYLNKFMSINHKLYISFVLYPSTVGQDKLPDVPRPAEQPALVERGTCTAPPRTMPLPGAER
jgi:hypothetical protein